MSGISHEPNSGEHGHNDPRRGREASGSGSEGGGGGEEPQEPRCPGAQDGQPAQMAEASGTPGPDDGVDRGPPSSAGIARDDAEEGREDADAHLTRALIDWAKVKARVLATMHATSTSLLPSVRPRFDRARHGNSLEDAVQQAIAEVIGERGQLAGDDEAFAAVLRRAKRRRKTWSETARSRDRQLEHMAATASAVDMLEAIERRNQRMVVAYRLYAYFANDREAKVLAHLVLERGFDPSKTAEIQKEIGECDKRRVENTKKRFRRGLKHVLTELNGSSNEGGTS